jgi:uncharacterized protein YbaA (DUF1428 family)
MPKYVDGYVLTVPKKKVEQCRRIAKLAGKVWRDHGALEYHECVGEDMNNKCGIAFPKLMKLKPGEVVVFSWITFKSRAHRDRVNKKVHGDKRLAAMANEPMPFDMKRMAYGGFSAIVDM